MDASVWTPLVAPIDTKGSTTPSSNRFAFTPMASVWAPAAAGRLEIDMTKSPTGDFQATVISDGYGIFFIFYFLFFILYFLCFFRPADPRYERLWSW
jgi:hypothetical protein